MEAFANQLAEVRNLDTTDTYKETLNQLEVEYRFILLRSLDLFHKEMGRSNLLERLHYIKEKICDTNQGLAYPPNLPFTGWNWDVKICRHCKRDTLRLRLFSNELCCENCGLLEPLDGVVFDYNELYHSFRYYLDKHLRICRQRGHNLADETVQKMHETFQFIEEHLPTRISMPLVAYKILKRIVPEGSEPVILNYFWLQVPQGSVRKHEEKWQNMLAKLMPKPTTGRCTNSCWCRGRCRSKRIREQMGHRRLRLLDGPSDCKDPNVCS